MRPVLLRLFLLLLLAIDWAADPYYGASPSSQPLASTEVVCRTLTISESVAEWSSAPCCFSPNLGLPALGRQFLCFEGAERLPVHLSRDLTYLFMSMQC